MIDTARERKHGNMANPLADEAPRQRYILESLSDRDRLYLMFDLLHETFLRDVGRALAEAGVSPDGEAGFRLLDAACGEGLHAADLAQRHPRCEIVAFDRDVEAMQTAPVAYAHVRNVRFLQHDAHDPLPDDVARGFDVAQLRFCLTHLTDPVRALRHLHDALRPGGVVYLIDPRGDVFDYPHPSMRALSDAAVAAWARFGTSSAGDRQVSLLEQAGFAVVASEAQDHEAGNATDQTRGMLKLLIETARSMRKALVETARVISADEFEAHLARLHADANADIRGRARLQITFARKA